jgi:hypothetical protein
MPKNPKRPRDTNQLAHLIAGIASGDLTETRPEADTRDPAAVALGRKGGLKGGAARAKSLTETERKRIAKRAAAARWKKH